ncbi:MAG TPA: histone deacetylase family protein [Alphaproteobacteria bacterium]|nr:histone deacetylase family protein [Alphaproteobacteria bacterium]
MKEHLTGENHPERPERIDAALSAVHEFSQIQIVESGPCTEEDVLAVHPPEYLEKLRSEIPAEGVVMASSGDVMLSPKTLEAAFHASGAICRAIDDVMLGITDNAYVLQRPGGHHAERETAKGFCIFAHAVVGARYAKNHYPDEIKKIAIVDFDIHGGNGTDDCVRGSPDEEDFMLVSSHQAYTEHGAYQGLYPMGFGNPRYDREHPTIINIPLPAGTKSHAFRAAYEDKVFPRLREFAPDLILVEAGYDGDARELFDVTKGKKFLLAPDDFYWLGSELRDIAREHSKGRIVMVMAGGYNLQVLADGTRASLAVLQDMPMPKQKLLPESLRSPPVRDLGY